MLSREESEKKIETLEKDLNDATRSSKRLEMKAKKETQELSLQIETLKIDNENYLSDLTRA